MEKTLLDEYEVKAVSGRWKRRTSEFYLQLEGGISVNVRPSNFESCFSFFETMGLDDDMNAIITFEKELKSRQYSPQELSDSRQKLVATHEEILSNVVREDVVGETFFAGNYEGVFDDQNNEKVVRAWISLIS